MDIFSRNTNSIKSPIHSMITYMDDQVANLNNRELAGQAMVSLENASEHQKRAIMDTAAGIQVAIESMWNELNLFNSPSSAQIDAAKQAGVMAGNWRGFMGLRLRDGLPTNVGIKDVVTVESYGVPDALQERSYAMEAYDERDNRSAVAYSITYNLQSARQDDFGETLFPTITIPADQQGVAITVNMLFVQDNVDRNISGATYELNRKNILRAVADPTVLRKEQTRAVPVYRTQSASMFVDAATLATRTLNIDGTDITTSALKVGLEVDLLGVSQSEAMIALGVQNQTDTLEPAVDLEAVYVEVGTDVLKFNLTNLPGANFVPAVQGDYKLSTLNFDTTSLLINKDTLPVNGTALTGDLADVVTSNLIIRMRMVMTGQVRTDTSNIIVYGNTFKVYQITDADTGDNISLTDPSVAALVTALNAGTFLGYDIKAYRSNANRRQQGQFVDVAKKYQRYMVPLRSPITARHPAHIDSTVDASDVQALITTTRIRTSNEAVTAILSAVDVLKSYVDVRDIRGEAPDVLGVGRYFVRPAFIYRDFDAEDKIDSVKSHERAADIQAALINEIRDIAYILYRDSEYKAASDAIYGGVGPIPDVIIATDPYTARYLNVTGDLRTLGGEFNFHIVSTLDVRMRGKIVIAFGIFDGDRNSSINPLNNGNLLWAPELVLTANIGRGGQFSRETLVQPRYRFITNLPVLGVIEVSNISNVLSKLPLFMSDVTPAP